MPRQVPRSHALPRMPALLLVVALVAGCASPPPRDSVSRVAPGLVTEAVTTDYGASHTLADDRGGALLGGYAGLLVGSVIGQGAGRVAAAGVGFLAGMFVGAAIENEIERRPVTEYRIRLETGEPITVFLRGPAVAEPGDRVDVAFFSDGKADLRPPSTAPRPMPGASAS